MNLFEIYIKSTKTYKTREDELINQMAHMKNSSLTIQKAATYDIERLKKENDQLKMEIINLEEALMGVNQELDDLYNKCY